MDSRKPEQAWSNQDYWQDRFLTGDTPWELGRSSPVIIEALDELTSSGFDLRSARILSPGCGRGSDALECARRGGCVLAVDWSDHAVAQTEQLYQKERNLIAGTLKVVQGDFFSLKSEPLDVVCEHTFFCAIDPTQRAEYVKRMAAWLRPGGFIAGNFFVLPPEEVGRLPGASLSRDGYGPPFAATESEVRTLFSEAFEVKALRPTKTPSPDRKAGLEWVGLLQRR